MAILYSGRMGKVDRLVEVLQKMFVKTVIWGHVGGVIGEKMVRAAFGPMLKFSSLVEDFHNLADELQMEEEMHAEVADPKERELKVV